jgi:hypothetical protein
MLEAPCSLLGLAIDLETLERLIAKSGRRTYACARIGSISETPVRECDARRESVDADSRFRLHRSKQQVVDCYSAMNAFPST